MYQKLPFSFSNKIQLLEHHEAIATCIACKLMTLYQLRSWLLDVQLLGIWSRKYKNETVIGMVVQKVIDKQIDKPTTLPLVYACLWVILIKKCQCFTNFLEGALYAQLYIHHTLYSLDISTLVCHCYVRYCRACRILSSKNNYLRHSG